MSKRESLRRMLNKANRGKDKKLKIPPLELTKRSFTLVKCRARQNRRGV